MRVTFNSIPDSMVSQLSVLTSRLSRLQTQASTGQRLQLPEDDPAAMRRVLAFQGDAGTLTQYQANIGRVRDQATVAYNSVNSLTKISDRVNEIATLADGTKSPQELNTYAIEVGQLIQQAVQIANTQFQGSYLFAGTQSDQAPFAATVDSNGNVTGVAYQGNTSVPQFEIATGVTVSPVPVGANATGTGPRGLITDSRTGADLFAHMISLQNHLQAGDTAGIGATDRPALAADEDNLIYLAASNGAIQSHLDVADSVAGQQLDSLDSMISREADADIAETLTRLSQTETAYRAALQGGSTLLNLSLLDYLT